MQGNEWVACQEHLIHLVYLALHAFYVAIVLQLPELQAYRARCFYLAAAALLALLYYSLRVSSPPDLGAERNAAKATISCKHCGQAVTPSGKHCHFCNKCIPFGWDHHCAFIGNCVARHNHRLFWAFLIVQWAGVAATFHFIFTARLSDLHMPWRPHTDISPLAKIALLLGLVFWLFFVGSLAAFHTFLAVSGLTTRDVMKPGPCTEWPTPSGSLQSQRGRQTLRSRMPASASAALANFARFLAADDFEIGQAAEQSSCSYHFDRMCDNEWYSCC